MKVEKTITITVTGVLTVTVKADKSKTYTGEAVIFTVNWTPAPYMIPPGCRVDISYGDGTSDTLDGMGTPVTFVKRYTKTGTMTVTASVYDHMTGASGSGSTTVQVATPLTVSFTADKTSGTVPLTVTFTFSMSGGYTPYTWVLDPGDGTTPYSNPTSPKSHTYNKTGTFTAKLTVTDALGATAAAIGVGGILMLVGRRE